MARRDECKPAWRDRAPSRGPCTRRNRRWFDTRGLHLYYSPGKLKAPRDTKGWSDVFRWRARTPRLLAPAVALCAALLAPLFLAPTPAWAGSATNVYVGTDRMHTAILLSQASFPSGLPADCGLVLAPAETYQQALCGAPLAAAHGGPVLLTYTAGLNNGVRAEMQRLGPERVICIGLPDAVIDEVEAAFAGDEVEVTAINGAGGSVYDMSYRVAKALAARVGDLSDATAIVTIGTNFPDAIGVSPLACRQRWPVLLTEYGDARPLNASAAAALSESGIGKALKVGTYCTLPTEVRGVGNCSGADRYETNANVAAWAAAAAGLGFTHLGICTGEKFPDALAAGPFLAIDGGSVLLTAATGVPPAVSTTLTAHAGEVGRLDFIGVASDPIWSVCLLVPHADPPFSPMLALNSTGLAVTWLETRLTGLTYRPGPVDGVFDEKTYHGMISFEKYEGLAYNGQVGAEDWAALAGAVPPVPVVATTGTWVEVDKTRQVLLYVVDGAVAKTLDVSTGSPDVGVETPNGSFTITKKIPNWKNGMYFQCVFTNIPPIGDISIHGLNTVPIYPASHGCVRTTLWDQLELYPQLKAPPEVSVGEGTRVFIYGVQPPSP